MSREVCAECGDTGVTIGLAPCTTFGQDCACNGPGVEVPCDCCLKGWRTSQLPQRQDSLEDQIRDVRAMANKMGCYDAADWIGRRREGDHAIRRAIERAPHDPAIMPGLDR